MSVPLARLNEAGISEFKEFLGHARRGEQLEPPFHLLESPEHSETLPGAPRLEKHRFEWKREAAEYLQQQLAPLGIDELLKDRGLWSWLGLLYFDSVCPARNGRRVVRADPHYLLDLHYGRVYRHLLRTPFNILNTIPRHNKLLLDQPLSVHGELVEQFFGGRLYVIRLPAVAELADRLYYDPASHKMRRGATSESRRGNLRKRLPIRVQQLMLTYDVSGMNADQLLEALGDEFHGWTRTPEEGTKLAGTANTSPETPMPGEN